VSKRLHQRIQQLIDDRHQLLRAQTSNASTVIIEGWTELFDACCMSLQPVGLHMVYPK
jgi:hypothetical protein